jgi:hypothetical protein
VAANHRRVRERPARRVAGTGHRPRHARAAARPGAGAVP